MKLSYEGKGNSEEVFTTHYLSLRMSSVGKLSAKTNVAIDSFFLAFLELFR